MAKDWGKLAGERGERVRSGRFERMLKLGGMGARVAASTLYNKATSVLTRQEDRQAHMAAQAAQSAEHMVKVMGQLKGASMKIGQLLSADPELVPEGFSDALSALQRDAPPMTWETVRAQIEAALDRPIDAVFSEFHPDPLGSASIGQVHRARLDDGREVAVKIQYPGVIDALESDLQTLGSMMGYAQAMIDRQRLDDYLSEIRHIILMEADYEAEARHLAHFHAIFAEREGLRCPAPVMEWTRPGLLVMEFIEGVKFDDALLAMEEGPRRSELQSRWVSSFSWMFHELNEMHADPHPGNFLLDGDDNLVLLDFGSVKRFDPVLTDALLDVLDALWQRKTDRVLDIYARVGFGGADLDPRTLDPAVLDGYHRVILEPFLYDEAFDFSDWEPAQSGKRYMMRNPSLLKLTPPPEILAYFRALSGIKGLLRRTNAKVNVCQMAIATAERRGRLTGTPIV